MLRCSYMLVGRGGGEVQHANDVQSAGSQGMDHLRVVHLLLELCPRAHSEPPGPRHHKPGARSLLIVIPRRQIRYSLRDEFIHVTPCMV